MAEGRRARPGSAAVDGTDERVRLNVTFADHMEAKRRGAWWDPVDRYWYVPPGRDPWNLRRWLPKDAVQAVLSPSNLPLTIELVPRTSWFSNVRSEVATAQWDRIRKAAYVRAHHRCVVCGADGRLEAHEGWSYDDSRCVQKLGGMLAICHDCHRCKHWGLTRLRGEEELAYSHFRKVNAVARWQAERIVAAAFDVWQQRSRRPVWWLDLTFLRQFDVAVDTPPGFPYVLATDKLMRCLFDEVTGNGARARAWLATVIEQTGIVENERVDATVQALLHHAVGLRLQWGDEWVSMEIEPGVSCWLPPRWIAFALAADYGDGVFGDVTSWVSQYWAQLSPPARGRAHELAVTRVRPHLVEVVRGRREAGERE